MPELVDGDAEKYGVRSQRLRYRNWEMNCNAWSPQWALLPLALQPNLLFVFIRGAEFLILSAVITVTLLGGGIYLCRITYLLCELLVEICGNALAKWTYFCLKISKKAQENSIFFKKMAVKNWPPNFYQTFFWVMSFLFSLLVHALAKWTYFCLKISKKAQENSIFFKKWR